MAIILKNILVIAASISLLPILFGKRFRDSITWQATITPLASIIGSGFLVSAPLIVLSVGKFAPIAMLIIVVIAYALGSIMRFNILHLEPLLFSDNSRGVIYYLETISRPALGIAYMISVAFYLKLLASFVLHGFWVDSSLYENILTTLILLFIGIYGWFKGVHSLEIIEKHAVNAKLTVIFTMIISATFYNIEAIFQKQWHIIEHNHDSLETAIQQLFGTLIIVQGFEISRYLGQYYSPAVRVNTMRYAQLISGMIYVIFISLFMILFNDISDVSETVVIDLCRHIAPILPLFLVFAAVMSQFSAAVADTIGSSGLISEGTNKILSVRQGTVLTIIITILLTWLSNIYEITLIASKAFAIYYGIQCLIAAIIAYLNNIKLRLLLHLSLFVLMVLVVILGIPVK